MRSHCINNREEQYAEGRTQADEKTRSKKIFLKIRFPTCFFADSML